MGSSFLFAQETSEEVVEVLKVKKIVLVDDSGNTRAVLQTWEDGSVGLLLVGQNKNAQVAIGLDSQDNPTIQAKDKEGTCVFYAPSKGNNFQPTPTPTPTPDPSEARVNEFKNALENRINSMPPPANNLNSTSYSQNVSPEVSRSTISSFRRNDSQTVNPNYIVYKTTYGEKYHEYNCRHLQKSKIEIKISEAQKEGLSPCSICNPPMYVPSQKGN
jgi:hypothetical protein